MLPTNNTSNFFLDSFPAASAKEGKKQLNFSADDVQGFLAQNLFQVEGPAKGTTSLHASTDSATSSDGESAYLLGSSNDPDPNDIECLVEKIETPMEIVNLLGLTPAKSRGQPFYHTDLFTLEARSALLENKTVTTKSEDLLDNKDTSCNYFCFPALGRDQIDLKTKHETLDSTVANLFEKFKQSIQDGVAQNWGKLLVKFCPKNAPPRLLEISKDLQARIQAARQSIDLQTAPLWSSITHDEKLKEFLKSFYKQCKDQTGEINEDKLYNRLRPIIISLVDKKLYTLNPKSPGPLLTWTGQDNRIEEFRNIINETEGKGTEETSKTKKRDGCRYKQGQLLQECAKAVFDASVATQSLKRTQFIEVYKEAERRINASQEDKKLVEDAVASRNDETYQLLKYLHKQHRTHAFDRVNKLIFNQKQFVNRIYFLSEFLKAKLKKTKFDYSGAVRKTFEQIVRNTVTDTPSESTLNPDRYREWQGAAKKDQKAALDNKYAQFVDKLKLVFNTGLIARFFRQREDSHVLPFPGAFSWDVNAVSNCLMKNFKLKQIPTKPAGGNLSKKVYQTTTASLRTGLFKKSVRLLARVKKSHEDFILQAFMLIGNLSLIEHSKTQGFPNFINHYLDAVSEVDISQGQESYKSILANVYASLINKNAKIKSKDVFDGLKDYYDRIAHKTVEKLTEILADSKKGYARFDLMKAIFLLNIWESLQQVYETYGAEMPCEPPFDELVGLNLKPEKNKNIFTQVAEPETPTTAQAEAERDEALGELFPFD